MVVGTDYCVQMSKRNPVKEAKKRRDAFVEQWKPVHKLGSKAPAFALPDRNGKVHRLAELHDRPLALFFYSNDHRSEVFAREFQKIWGHLGKGKLNAVAVVDFDPAEAKKFIKTTGDQSLYLFEKPGEHSVHRLYGAAAGPVAWVISRNGLVAHGSPPIETNEVPEPELEGLYFDLKNQVDALPAQPSGAPHSQQ